jgi:hypothetical protein
MNLKLAASAAGTDDRPSTTENNIMKKLTKLALVEDLDGRITANVPEFVHETLSPSCDVCGAEYAITQWNGRLLCNDCLEEELENDHASPRGDW